MDTSVSKKRAAGRSGSGSGIGCLGTAGEQEAKAEGANAQQPKLPLIS